MVMIMQTVSACSSSEVSQYGDSELQLDLKQFFSGKLKAYGIVKNHKGKVIRHFSADIDASWQGNKGTLDEVFYFSDGEEQTRVWTLEPNNNGIYHATANDVVGKHPMTIVGNALFMEYVLQLPWKGKTLDVKVDDRMFLVAENRIINESSFYKWGFNVANVQLVIEKLD